jgi:hypothetical protein
MDFEDELDWPYFGRSHPYSIREDVHPPTLFKRSNMSQCKGVSDSKSKFSQTGSAGPPDRGAARSRRGPVWYFHLS